MPKIIIVEDDPMISEIYQKKFLEAGFEVETADSGEQVLISAKKGGIDVILLDLIIPKVNGFDVIKTLRGGGYDPNIKIIVSSNLSQPEDKERASKLGANGFIPKSEFTPSAMVKEVGRLLNQYKEEIKNEMKNGVLNNEETVNSPLLSKKILLVEDEDIFLDMFGGKLKQDGYLVTGVNNGNDGMREALKNDYDLFIIDMIMPSVTGEELVMKLKLEERTKNKPVVMLAADADEEAQKRMEILGVKKVFLKTQLIPSELSAEVEKILS